MSKQIRIRVKPRPRPGKRTTRRRCLTASGAPGGRTNDEIRHAAAGGRGRESRAAVQALAAGRMVVVADDREREDEGDLVAAAALMSAEQMAFFLRHGSGIVCAPMSRRGAADELELPLMVEQNTESSRHRVHRQRRSPQRGYWHLRRRSGRDRSCAGQSRHPGHRPAAARARVPAARPPARPGGVLKRTGHTEAATDLVRLAGMAGVGVITELVGDDGVPLSGSRPVRSPTPRACRSCASPTSVRARRSSSHLVHLHRARPAPAGRRGVHRPLLHLGARRVEHLALTLGDLAAADARPDGVLARVT